MHLDTDICLWFDPGQWDPAGFFPLLQQGFQVVVQPGTPVMDLFREQFGLRDDYIEGRIKTVFLNGKPVDDFLTAVVGDGSTLALSAAMPGLVGAVLRKGGVLSPFRAAISYSDPGVRGRAGQGVVTVKLFNLLVQELGPGFLRRGVGIEPDRAAAFFSEHGDRLWPACTRARLEGRPLDVARVPTLNWAGHGGPVWIHVES